MTIDQLPRRFVYDLDPFVVVDGKSDFFVIVVSLRWCDPPKRDRSFVDKLQTVIVTNIFFTIPVVNYTSQYFLTKYSAQFYFGCAWRGDGGTLNQPKEQFIPKLM